MERGTQLRQHSNQLVVVIYPELYYYSGHFYVYIINRNTLLLSFVNLKLRVWYLMQKEFICFKE